MLLSKKFIRAGKKICTFEQPLAAPYFRKSFSLDFVPDKAELTVCGLGFYELYLNGKNITKGALAPYISNTNDVCYYDCYDVKEQLVVGENVIGVLLGNGFQNPFGGFVWEFDKIAKPLMFACALETQGEGKSLLLEADESFRTHPSPVLFDDLRMGYRYDARREIPHWNEIGFDDGAWTAAQLAEAPSGTPRICNCEPIVIEEGKQAIKIDFFKRLPFAYESSAQNAKALEASVRENVYVYDFGVNTAGVTELHINGKPGQKIVIRHGDHTVRGNFDASTNYFSQSEERLARYSEYAQTDVFICKGGKEVFLPRFKYDGFRYAYVEGLKPQQATKEALLCRSMHSELVKRSDFSCSDEVLNRLYDCCRRSDLSNFFYFPTDCPHREKNGWTGDTSASAEQMLLAFRAEESLGEYMASIRAAQNKEGALPGIVPTGGWGFAWGNGPAWDSVCVNVPYYIYKYSGNKEVIRENTELILKYFRYILSRRDDKGLIACGLGDWVDPFEEVNGKIAAPLEVTDSLMVFDMAKKAAFLFREIRDEKAQSFAEKVCEEMCAAIRGNLIDFDTMTVAGDCQTSQAFALETGIFKEEELPRARKKLVDIVHRNGDENACGMIGLRHIFHALSHAGETELAYRMITSKKRTGYGSWIADGATTLYESFRDLNGVVDSRNHHFLGDVSSWMFQSIGGIRPNPQGNDPNSFEIAPTFLSALTYANASYRTEAGALELNWERQQDKICFRITIPEGVCCRLAFEKMPEEAITTDLFLKAGEYRYTFGK